MKTWITIIKLIWWMLKMAGALVWWLVALTNWLWRGLQVVKAPAFGQGLAHMATCPEGHEFATTGVQTCGACGWTWQGSIWRCTNPECPSPVTAFVGCPECGLSVRNPFRG